MQTGILELESFTISCPTCKEKQKETNSGGTLFKVGDVQPGQVMKCQTESCGREFRLPKTLRPTSK